MPANDWTKVSQGIFHHFHNAWVQELASVLNERILPPQYYALSEQIAGRAAPDVIALEIAPGVAPGAEPPGRRSTVESGGVHVAQRPPRASIKAQTANLSYASLGKTIVIRHTEGHEVVAFLEVLSRASKASRAELDAFLLKAQTALKQRIHLLLVDLYPPGKLDPAGIHGELWGALGQERFQLPSGKGLLAAAYESADEITAYVEPFRAGDPLPEMSLFLDTGLYVEVPLEATYQSAFARVPAFWRAQLQR